MTQKAIANIIASYFANMAAMNSEGYLDNFAPDAISYDPVGEPPSKVHEGFQDFIGLLQASYKTLEAKTEHIFIAGNEYMLLSGKW